MRHGAVLVVESGEAPVVEHKVLGRRGIVCVPRIRIIGRVYTSLMGEGAKRLQGRLRDLLMWREGPAPCRGPRYILV